jgi:hypothetical protein
LFRAGGEQCFGFFAKRLMTFSALNDDLTQEKMCVKE